MNRSLAILALKVLEQLPMVAVLLPLVALADPCPPRHSNLQDLTALKDKFAGQWSSIQDEQALTAHCKTPYAPDQAALENYLAEIKSGRTESRTVNGINFIDEDTELLKLFAQLNAPNYLGNKKPQQFKSKCDKVLCALKELFGQKQGPQLAYLRHKFGYNGNHKIFAASSPWTSAELDDVLVALNDFPASFHPIAPNHQLTHFTRNSKGLDSKTIADATIQFYGAWDQMDAGGRQATLTHELGHNLAYRNESATQKRLDATPEWLNISGWTTTNSDVSPSDKSWKMKQKNQAVSRYGATNPSEDFAETVVAYRYNPQTLKIESPEKYSFMKDQVFDQIEYLTEATCRAGTKTDQARLANRQNYKKLLSLNSRNKSSPALSAEALSKIESACAPFAMNSFLSRSNQVDSCIAENTLQQEVLAAAQSAKLTNFDPTLLSNQELRDWPLKTGTIETTKKKIKEGYAQSLATALTEKYSPFDITPKPGQANNTSECTKGTRYSYQALASSSLFAKTLKTDSFFFYDRSKEISTWSSKICKEFNRGQRSLTEIIAGDLP